MKPGETEPWSGMTGGRNRSIVHFFLSFLKIEMGAQTKSVIEFHFHMHLHAEDVCLCCILDGLYLRQYAIINDTVHAI